MIKLKNIVDNGKDKGSDSLPNSKEIYGEDQNQLSQ